MRIATFFLILASGLAFPGPVTASDPVEIRDLLLQAVRLHDAGSYDAAIELYRRVLEQEPDLVEARYELAFSQFAKGDYEAAIPGLEKLAAEPENAPAGTWLLLGSAHAILGRWPAAEQAFRQGLTWRPDDEGLRYHLALSIAAQGRFEFAIEAFQDCLRDAPYRPELWRGLGDTLLDAGAKGRAFASYARALSLEDDTAASKDVARKMWAMLFEGVSGAGGKRVRVRLPAGTAPDATDAAEASGMGMLGMLREQEPWRGKTDAAFFAYAFDTVLALVTSLDERDDGPFWEPFLLDYFAAMRDAGHIETLAYEIRSAAGDPDAATWQEKNVAKVAAFRRSSERWVVDWASVR